MDYREVKLFDRANQRIFNLMKLPNKSAAIFPRHGRARNRRAPSVRVKSRERGGQIFHQSNFLGAPGNCLPGELFIV
jgi:hypothetical protein